MKPAIVQVVVPPAMGAGDSTACNSCRPFNCLQWVPHYFLRWRIFARMRRFFLPILRRPLPVFFVPTRNTPIHLVSKNETTSLTDSSSALQDPRRIWLNLLVGVDFLVLFHDAIGFASTFFGKASLKVGCRTNRSRKGRGFHHRSLESTLGFEAVVVGQPCDRPLSAEKQAKWEVGHHHPTRFQLNESN